MKHLSWKNTVVHKARPLKKVLLSKNITLLRYANANNSWVKCRNSIVDSQKEIVSWLDNKMSKNMENKGLIPLIKMVPQIYVVI